MVPQEDDLWKSASSSPAGSSWFPLLPSSACPEACSTDPGTDRHPDEFCGPGSLDENCEGKEVKLVLRWWEHKMRATGNADPLQSYLDPPQTWYERNIFVVSVVGNLSVISAAACSRQSLSHIVFFRLHNGD